MSDRDECIRDLQREVIILHGEIGCLETIVSNLIDNLKKVGEYND